jgi:hypothetical protein
MTIQTAMSITVSIDADQDLIDALAEMYGI